MPPLLFQRLAVLAAAELTDVVVLTDAEQPYLVIVIFFRFEHYFHIALELVAHLQI